MSSDIAIEKTSRADEGFLAFASAMLADSTIRLRPVSPADWALLATIYGSTRIDELQPVPWTAGQKKAFTDWQSAKQEEHYATHYPRAERLLIGVQREGDGGGGASDEATIGRIYVDTTPAEVRLMDITLLPEFRNRGIGTRLMEALLLYAESLQRPASLHVEPFNPAKRMYERMDFAVVETRGLYEFMVRPFSGPS